MCVGGRCYHLIPVLRYVEDDVSVAYGGYGSVRYQLSALWCTKVLVCTAGGPGQATGTPRRKYVFLGLLHIRT